jgi:hypothetical protein
MSVILEKAKALNKVIGMMEAIVREEIIKNEAFVSELNQSQLAEGQRPDGTSLPNYSATSVNSFGKPAGPIKLFDTGDFYQGIEPLFEDSGFDINGLDSKTDMLISRYGDILGLSKDSVDLLGKRIKPGIINKVREVLA